MVLLGVVIGVQWCSDVAEDAERHAALAAADSLRQRSDSLTQAHTTDSLAVAQVTEHLADSLARVDQRLRGAEVRTQQLTAALLALPDTLWPRRAVLVVLAAKDSLIGVQADKILTLVADTSAWRVRWARAERAGQAWRQVALDAQVQLAKANERSKPKRLGCTGGATGMVGLVGTGGLGVGLTCGLHLGH